MNYETLLKLSSGNKRKFLLLIKEIPEKNKIKKDKKEQYFCTYNTAKMIKETLGCSSGTVYNIIKFYLPKLKGLKFKNKVLRYDWKI